MKIQRSIRTPDIEIALQDFLELSPAEQQEFLLVGLLMTVQQMQSAK
jgi:hypothetical protein